MLLCVAVTAAILTAPAATGAPVGSPAGVHPVAVHDARVTAAGFAARRVVGGLNQPATFTFARDGRIFYGELKTGEIHIFNRKTRRDHLFFRVRHVVTDGEQGLLGLALHPRFPKRPFVYAYATRVVNGHLVNQILRIHAENGKGTGFRVIFRSNTVAGTYHDGGRILFGPDGMLYAVVGESHDSSYAQKLSSSAGKILRMTPRGAPAPGNPFGSSRIWAYGIRNSYGFDFDPLTGRLWETENGPECNDELNRIVKGGNFAWGPRETCSGTSPYNTNNSGPKPRHLPKRWFTPTIAPTGIAFCRLCGLGRASRGRFFFGNVNTGDIRRVTLTSNRLGIKSMSIVLHHNGGSVLSMETSPRGRIFFSDFGGIYRLVRT